MPTGDLIKAARKKAHMTQEELGIKLGVSGSMIAQYETGKRNPKYETLTRIAIALGVPISDICNDDLMKVFEASNPLKEIREIAIEPRNHLSLYATALQRQEAIKVLGGEKIARIVRALDKMNAEGQQKAVERIEELVEIPRYRRPGASHPSLPDTNTPDRENPTEEA